MFASCLRHAISELLRHFMYKNSYKNAASWCMNSVDELESTHGACPLDSGAAGALVSIQLALVAHALDAHFILAPATSQLQHPKLPTIWLCMEHPHAGLTGS